jgi:hypothetical protein
LHEININATAVFFMQTAGGVVLLRHPQPSVPTLRLITATSAIPAELYAFDLGAYMARLVEAGVQGYGKPLDPCWLYVPSGYKRFACFLNDVSEAAECASLYPDPYLGALFTAMSGRWAVLR